MEDLWIWLTGFTNAIDVGSYFSVICPNLLVATGFFAVEFGIVR